MECIKKDGDNDCAGGCGVERDVFNACFILCFLRGGEGNNVCLVWPLDTLYFLISATAFKYPLTDTVKGVQEGGGGVAVGQGGWRALEYSFLLVMDCQQVFLHFSLLSC